MGTDPIRLIYLTFFFSEPVDFAQREPYLQGLFPGIRDNTWEKAEMEDAIAGAPEEDDGGEKENHLCDPSQVYANEAASYYYSSVLDMELLRARLSSQWETELVDQIDGLITARKKDEKDLEEKKKKMKQENSKDLTARTIFARCLIIYMS